LLLQFQRFEEFLDLVMTSRIVEDEAMDTSSPRGGSSSDDSSLVDEYNMWRQNEKNTIKLREVLYKLLFCNMNI